MEPASRRTLTRWSLEPILLMLPLLGAVIAGLGVIVAVSTGQDILGFLIAAFVAILVFGPLALGYRVRLPK